MKKVLPILVILGIFALVFQVIVTVFINEKNVEYTLKTEDNSYVIKEHLEVIKDVSYYNIGITDKSGNSFSVFLEKSFNKQTQIVRDIKTFKSGNVSCVFPIYRRGVTGNVTCIYNDEAVTYDYLRQIGNQDIDAIVKQLKDSKYSHKSWDRVEVPKKVLGSGEGTIEVYQDNILDDYFFLIWRYKGLYILNSKDSLIKDYLENDVYDNTLSALVGKYYVTAFKPGDNSAASLFYYYNTKELGKGTINMPEAMSSEVYYNGVYKNKLYMTDVKNKKQYGIDPANEKIVEVGNSEKGFINIVDGKEKVIWATEFLTKPVYFVEDVTNNEIESRYGEGIKIIREGGFYYFKTGDGRFYRGHEDNLTSAELLFKFGNMTEWKVKNGDILFAAGNMVYFYNDNVGLVPLAVNNELNYNNKNIIDFWKK